MKKINLYIYIVLIVVVAYSFFFIEGVEASPGDNLSGYAYNTQVGYISFNCLNDNSCASRNYGISVDVTTGNLSGYAWSPGGAGYISFKPVDVAGCPSGSCTPKVVLAGAGAGNVTGYARILNATSMPSGGYVSLSDSVNYPTGNQAGTQGVAYNTIRHELVGSAYNLELGEIAFGPHKFICSDAKDNDGDGKIDSTDPGCNSSDDMNESNTNPTNPPLGQIVGVYINVPQPSVDFAINGWVYDKYALTHNPTAKNLIAKNPQSASVNGSNGVYMTWNALYTEECTASSSNNDPAWSGVLSALQSSGPGVLVTPTANSIYTISCTSLTVGAPSVSQSFSVSTNGAYYGPSAKPGDFFSDPADPNPFTVNLLPPSIYNSCALSTESGPYNNGVYSGPYTAVKMNPDITTMDVNPDPNKKAKNLYFRLPTPTNAIFPSQAYWLVFKCHNIPQNKDVQTAIAYQPVSKISIGPSVTLKSNTASSSTAPINSGTSITLSYGDAYNVSYCTTRSSPANGTWDGFSPSLNTSAMQNPSPPIVMTQTTTFYFECLDRNGVPFSVNTKVWVKNSAPAPVITLDAFPKTGLPANGDTTLIYTSENVASCTTTTSSAKPGDTSYKNWTGRSIGAWINKGSSDSIVTDLAADPIPNDATDGYEYDLGPQVSIGVDDTTFTLDCIGLDGSSVGASVTVTIDNASIQPTVSIAPQKCVDVGTTQTNLDLNVSDPSNMVLNCTARRSSDGQNTSFPLQSVPAYISSALVNLDIGPFVAVTNFNIKCNLDDGTDIDLTTDVGYNNVASWCTGSGPTHKGDLKFIEQ